MASLVFRKRPSEGMNDVGSRDTGHFPTGFQRIQKLRYRFSISALTVCQLSSTRMSTTTSKFYYENVSVKHVVCVKYGVRKGEIDR